MAKKKDKPPVVASGPKPATVPEPTGCIDVERNYRVIFVFAATDRVKTPHDVTGVRQTWTEAVEDVERVKLLPEYRGHRIERVTHELIDSGGVQSLAELM